MEKILITGASGFVGSFLVEEALKNGLDTYAGIRSSSSKQWLQDERINFIEMNLSNENQLSELMHEHQFDYIIHNAGVTKSNSKSDFFRVNVEFTHNLVTSSSKIKSLKKFSFMSSLAAYGPADFQENKILSNDSEPNPVTTYGKSKLRAERKLKEVAGLPLLIFRPTGIFGPRESDFLTAFKAIQNGFSPHVGLSDQWISLVYVKDLVRVIMDATISSVSNKSYFVTDGNLYKATKFNAIIADKLGKSPLKIKVPLPLVYAVASISEGISRLTGNASILNMDKFAEIKARTLDCDISELVNDFDYI
ncbi:MAG: NAD(P)-dependent oxidoreductase, partial [Saprospiraceae bacterium]|nr:NAD(P)-dependent oxidoreductase [Saprospiraceae bacterium]